MHPSLASLTILLFAAVLPAQFLRPKNAAAARLWGVKNGIVVGVHPDLRDPLDRVCPRGLLRIGLLRDGKPQLLNFLAIEPVVGGRKGLSELERSKSDGKPVTSGRS